MVTASTRRGVTLIESVVVLAIVGVGLAVALPAIHAGQIFARRMRTDNNLKQIALAYHNYASANGDTFPMSVVGEPTGKLHGVGHSGFTALLPYLEQVVVYNAYNFDVEPFHVANVTAVRTRIQTYLSAENKAVGVTKAEDVITLDGKANPIGGGPFGPLHFGMNWGGGHDATGADFAKTVGVDKGPFLPILTAEAKARGLKTNRSFADVIDGTSNTLGFVEKRASNGWAVGGYGGSEYDVHTAPQYAGDDPKAMRALTGSPAPAGPRGAFLDGSVRVLPPDLDKNVWYALQTVNGNEVVDIQKLVPRR